MTSRATARTTTRTTPRTTGSPRVSTRAGARATPRPELRLVPGDPASRSRRRPASFLRNRRAPYVLLVVALLVGTTLGLLVLNTVIAVDSLKATHLRTENAARAQEVQRLERQVVSGSTPGEVARAAAAAGLVPAGTAAYLIIGRDGTTVLRGTPAPAVAAGTDQGGN